MGGKGPNRGVRGIGLEHGADDDQKRPDVTEGERLYDPRVPGQQDDDVVEVCAVVETSDPARVRRGRVGQRRENHQHQQDQTHSILACHQVSEYYRRLVIVNRLQEETPTGLPNPREAQQLRPVGRRLGAEAVRHLTPSESSQELPENSSQFRDGDPDLLH